MAMTDSTDGTCNEQMSSGKLTPVYGRPVLGVNSKVLKCMPCSVRFSKLLCLGCLEYNYLRLRLQLSVTIIQQKKLQHHTKTFTVNTVLGDRSMDGRKWSLNTGNLTCE